MFCDHGGRTVVEVEHDGVVGVGFCTANEGAGVLDLNFDPRIFESRVVQFLKMLAVPLDDGWDEFNNFDGAPHIHRAEDTFQGETEAESADEDACGSTCSDAFNTYFSEKNLGGVCAGVHELLPLEADGVVAVLFEEGHDFAIGVGGLGKFGAWFHCRGS